MAMPKSRALDKWTAEDNAMLKALYSDVDPTLLAALLSCSVPRMRKHIAHLGLRSARFWSQDEDEVLRKHFPRAPVPAFAPLLPGRSVKGIYWRAGVLALSRDPSYMLNSSRHSKFLAYPPELRSLINLHQQVERKLRDVQAQHRKSARAPV